MLRLLVATTLAIAAVSCGSSLREIDGQAGAAGALTPAPTATPGTPLTSPAAGWVRISDDAGGWSMDMPQGWFERAAHQHGRELRSYDPSIPLPGNYSSEGLPPVGQVLLRMQMQATRTNSTPSRSSKSPIRAKLVSKSVNTRGHDRRSTAEFWSLWRSQRRSSSVSSHALVVPAQSVLDDRMVVIYAAPGESPLRRRSSGSSQRRFYKPSPASLVPTVSRRDAIDAWCRVRRQTSTATRVEAKLTSTRTGNVCGGSRSYTRIPTPVWVVAYVAPDITTRRGVRALGRSASPQHDRSRRRQRWSLPVRSRYRGRRGSISCGCGQVKARRGRRWRSQFS